MTRKCYFVMLLCMISSCLAKIFSKCELLEELQRQGFPEYLLKDLICMIEAESAFQTDIRSGSTKDGSFNWGLFQINDRHWCNAADWPGKRCNVRCKDLLSDDISVAAYCAHTIITQRGLSAWPGWVNHCKNKHLPDIHCTPLNSLKVFVDFI